MGSLMQVLFIMYDMTSGVLWYGGYSASRIRSSPAVVRVVLVSYSIVNDGSEPTLRYRSTYPQNKGKFLRRGGLILRSFFPTKTVRFYLTFIKVRPQIM